MTIFIDDAAQDAALELEIPQGINTPAASAGSGIASLPLTTQTISDPFKQTLFNLLTMSMNANPGNVIGGHKANISNPKTSEESKQHSRQVIEDMEEQGYTAQGDRDEHKNEGNVIGGHKANLNNPNTSEEAKEHSRRVLEEKDAA